MADARPTDDDLAPAADLGRFSRFAPTPSARRFAVSKAGRMLVASLILAGILWVGGATVANRMVAWLIHQPVYTVDLNKVEFVDPVPPWIPGGKDRLLASLRPFAKGEISIHDLDLPSVFAELSKNPWVYKVDRVDREFPNELKVRLQYKKPVIRINRTDGPPILLDRFGVVFPEDIELGATGPLIQVHPKSIPTPLTAGLAWPGEGDQARVLASAELAAYFLDRLASEPEVLPQPDQISIYPESNGFWVELGAKNFLYWGAGPQVDAPKEPTRSEKWEMLRAWVKKSGPLKAVDGQYYHLTRDGLELKAPPKGRG